MGKPLVGFVPVRATLPHLTSPYKGEEKTQPDAFCGVKDFLFSQNVRPQ